MRRRVLIGTEEVAFQVSEIAAGFRALGHDVTTVARQRNPFYPDVAYDHLMEGRLGGTVPGRVLRKAGDIPRRIWSARRYRQLADDHDTFVFVFGSSLLPSNRDLELLSSAGKEVIAVFLGSDIRHWSAAEQFREQVGLGTYAGYRTARTLDEVLLTLRSAELHATRSFFQPSFGELAIAPYHHLSIACDPERFEFRIPDRAVPRIVHAPSRRAVKGTEEILAALDQLRAEGVEFELVLLEGVPNSVVRTALRDADILVDELNEAYYGMLALEAMASGCAVACGNRSDIVPHPAERPIEHVSPDTIREVVRRLVEDQGRRRHLAEAGRSYVQTHHAPTSVAAQLLEPEPGQVYTPTFFRDHFVLPEGTDLHARSLTLNRRVADHTDPTGRTTALLSARGLA